ncbi:Hypothetical protein SRAE_X000037900 [Strongyloides ratti]|uniref:Uncharacterized protein n=1 Tax=Strongyloides ratti TaxID=34506 RepID=A0A090LS63_STRRB|nr:Hypothetical protein SRAE_X000037900 [Strongyloides ratti]CEF71052.1 Hypothetical protein SRAE_X000037900 [Strongyloides ratti]
MRFILFSFLFLIFAFQYYSWRFPGMGRGHRSRYHGLNGGQLNQLRNFNHQKQQLQRRASHLNHQTAQFQRMRGRKKRDLYETFEKVLRD